MNKFLKHVIALCFHSLLFGCSSPEKNKISNLEDNNYKNVEELLKINPNDPSYLIYASRAIEDLKKGAIANLKTHNSSLALKYSSTGALLFPFRDDLINLKQESVIMYVNSLKNHIDNKTINCSDLNIRLKFLNEVAPDISFPYQIENCTSSPSKSHISSFKTLYMTSSPSELIINQNNSKNNLADELSSELINRESYLNKLRQNNEYFPFYEMLSESFELLKKLKLEAKQFKLDKNSIKDDKNFVLFSSNSEIVKVNKSFLEDHCDSLEQILHTELGSIKTFCFKSHDEYKEISSTRLVNKSKDIFFNKYFYPRYTIIEKIVSYSDGLTEVKNFLIDSSKLGNVYWLVLPDQSNLMGAFPRESENAVNHNNTFQLPEICEKGICVNIKNDSKGINISSILLRVNLNATFILNSELFLNWKKNENLSKSLEEILLNWTKYLSMNYEDYIKSKEK
jgi:hypothetical protein